MKKLSLFIALMIAMVTSIPTYAGEFSSADEKRIKELAIQAILERPEVIEKAITRLRQLQEEQKQQAALQVIKNRRNDLIADPNAPVLGNPKGDVTVVEFFDYNCPYCKKAMPVVKQLIEADKNVRLVYRELPILSEGSIFAARAALAARKQGKYEELHVKLMSAPRADATYTLRLAKELGLDIEKLKADMEAPEVDQHIQLSMDLANGLNINGTPSFVIGNRIAPGLVPIDQLNAMVAEARASSSE